MPYLWKKYIHCTVTQPTYSFYTHHSTQSVPVERRSRHTAGGHEEVQNLELVFEYSKYMGDVDQGDQLLSYHGFPHHTAEWWRHAFFYLLDAAIETAIFCLARWYRYIACHKSSIELLS